MWWGERGGALNERESVCLVDTSDSLRERETGAPKQQVCEGALFTAVHACTHTLVLQAMGVGKTVERKDHVEAIKAST